MQNHVVTQPEPAVVVAASFTASPLSAPYAHARQALGAGPLQLLPYGQVIESLLDPGRGFGKNALGLNVCLVQLRAASGGHGDGDPLPVADGLAAAVRAFAEERGGQLAICLCPNAPGPGDDRLLAAEARIVADLADLPGVTVCRASEWFETYGVDQPFDREGEAIADLPYTEAAFAALALGIARVARSLSVRPRKVIAVDCDYTLWEGACGDMPPSALGLSPRFRAVQAFLRERGQAGFMLALCTRNDPEAVERVFRERAADLAIGRADFVAAQTGWTPKSQHLQALASTLGVGLDGFILVDDDPFVCAEVTAHLPQVAVVHLPVEEDALTLLRRTPAFDHFFVTEEDRKRPDSYRADTLRAVESGLVTSVAELNQRLGTSIVVAPAERRHWPRVEQLFARTNQFTSATLSPAEVRTALQNGAPALVVSVSDRFGDYGIVAAAILADRDGVRHLDCLAMSCRVLNRGVDDALLLRLRDEARGAGRRELRARLRDTGRNRLAKEFLAGHARAALQEHDETTYVIACDAPLAPTTPPIAA